MQLFVKSPRRKSVPEINNDDVKKCKEYIKQNNIFLVIHGSYLINIASKDDYEYKHKSVLQDIKVAHQMGAIGAVFHVGKQLKMQKEEAVNNMKEFIKNILVKLDDGEKFILETGAGCGTEMLCNLQELGDFYNSFTKEEKNKMSICLDTCHIFSAGYDIKTKSKVKKFVKLVGSTIGWANICVIHLNDSKKDCGCGLDRHEILCKGCIGDGLKYMVRHFNDRNIPLILETPSKRDDKIEELDMIKKWIKD